MLGAGHAGFPMPSMMAVRYAAFANTPVTLFGTATTHKQHFHFRCGVNRGSAWSAKQQVTCVQQVCCVYTYLDAHTATHTKPLQWHRYNNYTCCTNCTSPHTLLALRAPFTQWATHYTHAPCRTV